MWSCGGARKGVSEADWAEIEAGLVGFRVGRGIGRGSGGEGEICGANETDRRGER